MTTRTAAVWWMSGLLVIASGCSAREGEGDPGPVDTGPPPMVDAGPLTETDSGPGLPDAPVTPDAGPGDAGAMPPFCAIRPPGPQPFRAPPGTEMVLAESSFCVL